MENLKVAARGYHVFSLLLKVGKEGVLMVAERSQSWLGTKFGVEKKEMKFVFISKTECF